MISEEYITDIWSKYENGRDQHMAADMYKSTERCHRFYEGDQWHGLQSGGEELPTLNFIKPICTYKIATVAMNTTAIIYSSMSENSKREALCSALNDFAAKLWEKTKMERIKWEIVKNACISGDAYLYCYDKRNPSESVKKNCIPQIRTRMVCKTDIYLSDEQNPDINEQEWIIIAERASVSRIKEVGKQNGISAKELGMIALDNIDNTNIGVQSEHEVKSDDGKCTSLLYMRKTAQGIEFCRSVKNVIYQKPAVIHGLDVYPVCSMRWLPKMGSARGVGVVESIIANQIEVNRTIARRAVMVKKHGFASLVYDQDKIVNVDSLGKIGSSVAVRNLAANPMQSIVQYLTPAPMSPDAAALQGELVQLTRELEGAGEAATGQINPERASGEAIKAARDQSALSLNEQSAAYKQFVEDLALIWLKLWTVYSPGGIELSTFGSEKKMFSHEELKNADLDIRIDISPADPYSILSRQLAIEGALAKGHISFEEYVELLDANSGVPKDKFQAVLSAREKTEKENAEKAPEMQGAQAQGMPQAADIMNSALPQGGAKGDAYAVPQM